MTDTQATGNYYTIGHIVQFTGLTDRTIRNYIAAGILAGEKINGIWHFTPEQVEAFIADPAVYPSIRAKNNALAYDFLLDNHKKNHQTCIILDLPGENQKTVAEFFCYSISNGDYRNLQFTLDAIQGETRVILKGEPEMVLALVQRYYQDRK